MMDLLDRFRDSLATIPGIASCKIGLEDGISPDQYPLIRLVPVNLSRMNIGPRKMELLIYFGMPIQAIDDTPDANGYVRLEKVYAALFELEAAIGAKLAAFQGGYEETITDEDRLDTYKLMAIRCWLIG